MALLHVPPAIVLFVPRLTDRLYGIDPTGDAGLLVVHRGGLFLAVSAAAIFALFDPGARKLASVIVSMSMLSFLWLYAQAGFPGGSLRTIAIMDAVGLPALAAALWSAWR